MLCIVSFSFDDARANSKPTSYVCKYIYKIIGVLTNEKIDSYLLHAVKMVKSFTSNFPIR